jgi:hypothetical protein
MPNPRVSLRSDQLIPVNKEVNEKEQFGKRDGGGGGRFLSTGANPKTFKFTAFSWPVCFYIGDE